MTIEKILAEVFSLPESCVTDALMLKEVSTWDSLAHMMLIVRLEETYGVQFTGDEIADIQSVADVRSTLQAHGIQP